MARRIPPVSAHDPYGLEGVGIWTYVIPGNNTIHKLDQSHQHEKDHKGIEEFDALRGVREVVVEDLLEDLGEVFRDGFGRGRFRGGCGGFRGRGGRGGDGLFGRHFEGVVWSLSVRGRR